MKLFMFAGPNGAGKSTFIDKFLKQPDNASLLYLCPDAIFKTLYRASDDYNVYLETYKKAMDLTKILREATINRQEDFAFETVFSRHDKVEFLGYAKSIGYEIISYFITTNDVNINIERVKLRVSQGGHDVPTEKVKSRYYKSLEQMQYLFPISNEFYILDNSIDNSLTDYRMVYQQKGTDRVMSNEFINEKWVKDYIFPYIST